MASWSCIVRKAQSAISAYMAGWPCCAVPKAHAILGAWQPFFSIMELQEIIRNQLFQDSESCNKIGCSVALLTSTRSDSSFYLVCRKEAWGWIMKRPKKRMSSVWEMGTGACMQSQASLTTPHTAPWQPLAAHSDGPSSAFGAYIIIPHQSSGTQFFVTDTQLNIKWTINVIYWKYHGNIKNQMDESMARNRLLQHHVGHLFPEVQCPIDEVQLGKGPACRNRWRKNMSATRDPIFSWVQHWRARNQTAAQFTSNE